VRILRVLLHHLGALEALLVAQLDAAQIQHTVLHGGQHLLSSARRIPLVERGHDAEREVESCTAVADLRAGHQRRAVIESRGRGRAPRALRHVLVNLAVLIRTRAEALYRSNDHARVQLLDPLPGEPHAVESARSEILHEHVAVLDQPLEHSLALRALGIESHRPLVVIQHGEVQAVGPGNVAQLLARDVAAAGLLDLDHVGAEPGQQLCASRSGLHVREIENAYAA
jgi:hypothetical protein